MARMGMTLSENRMRVVYFMLYMILDIEYNHSARQIKEGKMPTKPVKKTNVPASATKKAPAKKTVAKKTVAQKTAAKKPVAKRPAVRTAQSADVNVTKQAAPVVEDITTSQATHLCACGEHCQCGDGCRCARGGSRFGRFVIKLIVALIIFALGWAAAQLVNDGRGFRGPRVDFDDGCLVVSSVKCPQLQALLPVMDMDQDGCITRQEFRAVDAELRRQMRAQNAQ